jgi:hypothetical protein
MKTGRVRKKAKAAPKSSSKKSAGKSKAPASRSASRSTVRSGTSAAPDPLAGLVEKLGEPKVFFSLLFGTFAFLVLLMILLTNLGGRKADDWVPVSQARGHWTATVEIWGPQATYEERWEADCRSDPQASVQPGTCIAKDTEKYRDQVVDDYEEYAYNIYYEETYEQVYEARGASFVATGLETDDWWDENLHYMLEEELDTGSCAYTDYTTWVDDPDDATLEIEVYLSECEVWDHVTVYERVYEQDSWCGCQVITMVEMRQDTAQGTGASIRWPSPAVPAGGRTERVFQGTVTFQGDDYTYTATTDDVATYYDYVVGQYYIGLDDGEPIRVSKNPE